ncbi:DUF952 domain-containing protein [Magnetospira thiophila]
MTVIHHLAHAESWRQAQDIGFYDGLAADRADGFLHFSTGAQIRESAARHRAGETGLLLLTVLAEDLGADLRWEKSRGGALFPHLYGRLSVAQVQRVDPLPLDGEGRHVFPADLFAEQA